MSPLSPGFANLKDICSWSNKPFSPFRLDYFPSKSHFCLLLSQVFFHSSFFCQSVIPKAGLICIIGRASARKNFPVLVAPRNSWLLFCRRQNHFPGRLVAPSPNSLVANIDFITFLASHSLISILCHAPDFLISTHYL